MIAAISVITPSPLVPFLVSVRPKMVTCAHGLSLLAVPEEFTRPAA